MVFYRSLKSCDVRAILIFGQTVCHLCICSVLYNGLVLQESLHCFKQKHFLDKIHTLAFHMLFALVISEPMFV